MKVGSLCSGYGGLDLAVLNVFGGELAWWSDVEPGPVKVMTHHHPQAPNLGDLKLVDWSAVEPVGILTAGYPCQPFSNAGKRLGTEDPRHLWPWIARAVGVLRPRIIVLENVAAHLRRGFDVVSADLAALGYDAAWTLVRASDVGAAHRRERLFIVAVAHADGRGLEGQEPAERLVVSAGSGGDAASDAQGVGRREGRPEPAGLVRRPDASGRGEPSPTHSPREHDDRTRPAGQGGGG
ncbi:DNA cytosine methyltransferase [Lentzea sp. NBRC 102530]|uniref:DNA cytosine methyltransferase n=1 Tax=Lentzea sp. NBRC 102530 TaxID=3032201 RepID=UPI0024A0FDD7|nr:DNA cytosine methyltransferase [Lentzea sp. NBRC 102530]GLY55350.1 hypothetical protein Lesp01_90050 [Lentzea sp. NBRC 102530]